MEFDLLLTPLSSEAPSGPDLDDAGDGAYFNYIVPARDRLPGRFFINPATGEAFDSAQIDIRAEEREIFALLARSRDLRLVALLAQFRVLKGYLSGFAESLELIAKFLAVFWDSVHPADAHDGFEMRAIALGALDQQIRVILPLTYLPLIVDQRHGAISLHDFEMAEKPQNAPARENAPSLADLKKAMASSANLDQTSAAQSDLQRCQDALRAMAAAWRQGDPDGPDFALARLDSIIAAMVACIPDMSGAPTGEQPALAQKPSGNAIMKAVKAVFRPENPSNGALSIKSHAEAKAILQRLERYFADFEPSSPCGLLVKQARILVGRPMIEALEALAPDKIGAMRILIDTRAGFSLDAAKLRELSSVGDPDSSAKPSPDPSIVIASRGDVLDIIHRVEDFLIEAEPSSPVPLLLAQARTYIGKDFTSIFAEISPARSTD